MRTEDPAEFCGPLKMIEIGKSQQTQISNGNGIDPGEAELTRHLSGNVLVQIEADLAQRVEARPWASRR